MGGKAFCGYWLQFAPVNVHQPIFEHQSSPEFQTKSSRSSGRHPCDLKWSVAATCLQTLDLDMLAYEDEDTSTESPYDWSPLPKKKNVHRTCLPCLRSLTTGYELTPASMVACGDLCLLSVTSYRWITTTPSSRRVWACFKGFERQQMSRNK